jgi:hypothetical protein
LLKKRLGLVGLALRRDSKVCEEFIRGEREDLDAVVETMQEMDFLFRRTDYQIYMSREIENWKRDIRDTYGWLDGDEFHDMLQEDLPDLSWTAKRKAVKKFGVDELPAYLHKYR